MNTPDEFEAARAEHLPLASAGNVHHFVIFLIDAIRRLRRPGLKRDAGSVVITMTPEDWSKLLLTLGYAGQFIRSTDGPAAFSRHLALLNRLNAGNPNWTPYQVDAEGPK
jgi:hypothetical protein